VNFDLNKIIGLLKGKLESWLESTASMLPNFFVAALVLAVFYMIAKFTKPFLRKVLSRISTREVINNLFVSVINFSIIGIGLFISLDILHLDKAVTSLLAGAGIVGLAIGFAFQDISANFIAGTLIAVRRPITIGDIIDSNGFFGTVEEIDLRKTIIRTFQGLHVIIPNKDVFQNPLTNYTKTSDRRIDLSVGISYAENLEKAEKITKEAILGLDAILPNKDVMFSYEEFGDSSINFKVMFWIEYKDEPAYLAARSEAIKKIKSAYDAHDITIPFPIRTLDFGIKGGKTINEMPLKINKE
jgi:small conductance mechanosensitive channel